jgi:integrase
MAIRQRGDRYQVRLRLGSGRRIEKTLPKGASFNDARAVEAAIIRAGIDKAIGREPERTIDDAIDRWEASSARHLKSWQTSLRYRVDVVRQFTRGRKLDELPEVGQEIMQAGMKANLKPATINRHLAVLKRVGNLALKWGWTDRALGKRIEQLPGERSREIYLTPTQVRALMLPCSPEARDAIMFAALTGFRRGEMLRAQLRGKDAIVDSNTKSGKPRVVPLVPDALAIAKRRIPWQITPDSLRNQFERARKLAGLEHVQFRDLRHTFASWFLANGGAMGFLRDLMGHSTLAVTSKYAHLAGDDLSKAINKAMGKVRLK